MSEELAYFAGLFDGEGCVNFTKCRAGHIIRISVTNTNIEIIKHLQNRFGGHIQLLSLRKDNWKQGFSWNIANSRAIEFLKSIRPWLRIKDAQADLAVVWAEHRPGKGKYQVEKSQAWKEAVTLLREEMAFLNKKGCSVTLRSPIEEYLELSGLLQ